MQFNAVWDSISGGMWQNVYSQLLRSSLCGVEVGVEEEISAVSEALEKEATVRAVSPTRRRFFRQAGAIALAGITSSRFGNALPRTLPNPVGYATISWPRDEFGQALETISALGYRGIHMLGWVRDAYQGGKIQELRERLQRLRLVPTALSCGGADLEPGRPMGATGKFRDYMAFMSSLGGYFLQMPVAGRPDRKYSAAEIKSLGSSMNEFGKLAKESGLTLGYHPHLGTMGETREGLGQVLEATDPRYVGLIADVAHLALGGSDPTEVIRTYHQRLIFLHLKDARRDTYALARQNRASARKAKYRFCEIGRGVVNFPAIVAALRDVQFRGWVVVELDRYEPLPVGPAESARINKEALRQLGFNI